MTKLPQSVEVRWHKFLYQCYKRGLFSSSAFERDSLAFLSEELDNQKNEDIKFIGKLKREWYQKGANEQKKEMIERVEKMKIERLIKNYSGSPSYRSVRINTLDDIIQAINKNE